ncbi:MAG: sigma-70 family RNA polymerase sigma factor [Deltaproteobacteria bacterium]|nr:sigma-70 family RNA polymerase sigma factor [Deltaproteobacteria bacterium]
MLTSVALELSDPVPADLRAEAAARPVASEPDRRAFDAMVAEHLPALRTRAGQLCRRHVDPDDVIQDALVRAFRGRDQLRDRDRARGWLLSIVTNTFIDALRKQRSRPDQAELPAESPAPAPEEPTAALPWQQLGEAELRAAIARLPDELRDTYRMFALENLDYVAIAAAQNIPKATVGTRLLRARKRLRALLAAELEAR